MRQAGTLPDERDAQRLTFYLIGQGIDSQCDAEGKEWAVWVRDEDRLPEARGILEEFRRDPQAAKFQGTEKQAEARVRADLERRRRVQGNVVDVGRQWATSARVPTARRAPLTIALILVSVIVALLTNFGAADPRENSALRALKFRDPGRTAKPDENLPPAEDPVAAALADAANPWPDISRGELWRVLTPIFLHFGMMHLAFNMYAMFLLSGQMEDRRGTGQTLGLVLVSGIVSNIAQAAMHGPNFGGMSGVAYAMLGFIAIRLSMVGAERYRIDQTTIFIALSFLVLGILRDLPAFEPLLQDLLPRTANWAHGVGLVVGMAYAWLLPRDLPR